MEDTMGKYIMEEEFNAVNFMIDRAIDNNTLLNTICSKSNLGRIIKWTSSKYNEYKKSEVVQDVINKTEINDNLFWKYSCGSYAEGNHNRGNAYYLMCRRDGNYLISVIDRMYKVYKLWEGDK